MKQVLAGRDFRDLEAPTARDTALEKLGEWLNQLFEQAPQSFRPRGLGGARDRLGIHSGRLRGAGLGADATGAPLAHPSGAGERRTCRRSRLGPRLATLARGCAPRRRRRPVARGDSFRLLGGNFTAGIEAAVARRPRAHSARVPGAGGRRTTRAAPDWPRSPAALSAPGMAAARRARAITARLRNWPTG